ncbi:nuclear transport factor 2 family protein [Kribbella sp. NPDC051952]|uniref:nuclear transport factor 2 family protein n=1 Tax=Kribbella sp. NPDC051952 TaxID=3154851 RepID=UPI003428ECA5
MPWFPEFSTAIELARRDAKEAGQSDPVAQYLKAFEDGRAGALERVWPGEVIIHDPRAGEVRGHRELRSFVHSNKVWLSEHQSRISVLTSISVGRRAVVELEAHVLHEGREVAWPMAVVADSTDERSVDFRTYCSQWPVDGRRHVRPPVLEAGEVETPEIVAQYLSALAGGDAESIVKTFAPDGYLREPIGPDDVHRGSGELSELYSRWFSDGGIKLEYCATLDDGANCALEYNLLAWGGDPLPPQAGLAVFERGPQGRLAAVRLYDDVEPPRTAPETAT